MEHTQKHIIIVAGEASGDLHAAHLVKKIKELNPSFTFSGLGGPKMAECGVELYQDLTKFAVVGFSEVLRHYGVFYRAFHLILDKIKKTQPVAVILVDYPGFNLRLAKKLKKYKTKVIYYISPQVWAWKKNRVYEVKKYIDKMLVLFPFEKTFYQNFGVDATFVGHPLLDVIKVTAPKSEFLEKAGLSSDKLTIGLLPGSREKEIERILPSMMDACQILNKKFPAIQFMLMKAPTIKDELIEPFLKTTSVNITLVEDNTYNAVNACDLCMVASGTATLETAILGKPMVIIYKTSLTTWGLAKTFIKIPYIGLVNVVAGKKIVPECIQFDATGEKIAGEIKNILTDETKIAQIKLELGRVKNALGQANSINRAAQEVLSTLIE